MVFQVRKQDGTLMDVPDNVEITVQGLRIIGDGKTDWNEPYGQNFMVLSKEIKDLETTVANLPQGGSVDLTGYQTKAELGTIADFTAALG